jgi:hypothetical protein
MIQATNGRSGPRGQRFGMIPTRSRAIFPAGVRVFPTRWRVSCIPWLFASTIPARRPSRFPHATQAPPFRHYSLSVFGGLNHPYSRSIVAECDERCLLVLLMFLLQLAPG